MAAAPSRKVTSRWRRRFSYLQDGALIAVSFFFFYAQAVHVANGRVTSIPFAVEQALLIGIFLTRRRSIATSQRPVDWVLAACSWASVLARPADSPSAWAADFGLGVQMFGLTLTCIAFLYLGRSFGVVAANRGLKVNGPYRFVRHPIYLSHTITTTGFVVANFSTWNLFLLVFITVVQVFRIRAEERVLSASSDYASYRARVRWRLVPGLY
jgi:protein-S-isoprenylcysteine O-methyltransferase Ste14